MRSLEVSERICMDCKHADSIFAEITLLIPQAASDSIQRVTLDPDTPFADVLELIHETIPCTDVNRKPDLSYKLSNAAAKAPAIRLKNAEDWDGCLETLVDAEAAKKKQRGGKDVPTNVPVNIIIPEAVCLFCFCYNSAWLDFVG
jgi:hypothetical protein